MSRATRHRVANAAAPAPTTAAASAHGHHGFFTGNTSTVAVGLVAELPGGGGGGVSIGGGTYGGIGDVPGCSGGCAVSGGGGGGVEMIGGEFGLNHMSGIKKRYGGFVFVEPPPGNFPPGCVIVGG